MYVLAVSKPYASLVVVCPLLARVCVCDRYLGRLARARINTSRAWHKAQHVATLAASRSGARGSVNANM